MQLLLKRITYLLSSVASFGLIWWISTIIPLMYSMVVLQLLAFIALSIVMVLNKLFNSEKIFPEKLWIVSCYGMVLGVWLGLILFAVIGLLSLG